MAEQHDPLAAQPAFALLGTEARSLLLAALEPASYSFGDLLVEEGQSADAFFVMVDGAARVVRRDHSGGEVALATLRAGDVFGEAALLAGHPRTATVRASSAVSALRLHRAVFDALVSVHPEIRTSMENLVRLREISDYLRLGSEFSALSDRGLAVLAESLQPVRLAAGETLFGEGDPPGPLYMVRQGRLRVTTAVEGDVAYLRAGDHVGEASLLRGTVRNASVIAVSDCDLLCLPVEGYERLLADEPMFRAVVEQRLAQYEFRSRARVPLDFADELLPTESVRASSRPATSEPTAHLDDEPLGEVLGSDEGKGRRLRRLRTPLVFQVDEADCGAACIAMVCGTFGRRVALWRIREAARTSTDGTTLAGLTEGARELGLSARAVRVSASKLDEIPLPAIVHWEGNHWVVLERVGRNHVRIADPSRGHLRMRREEALEAWSGFACIVGYTPALENAPRDQADLRWLRPLMKPHARLIAIALALSSIAAVLELVLPILTQYVVDDLVGPGDTATLWRIVPALLVVMLGLVAAAAVERYLLAIVAVRFDTATLDFLTHRLLELPTRYFSTRRTGDIERRLGGAQQIRHFFIDSLVQLLTAITTLVAAMVLMFVYSVQLALLFLVSSSLYLFLMRYSATRLRPMYDSLEESYGKYTSGQIDSIRGIETVKALAVEEQLRQLMLRRFQSLTERMFRSQYLVLAYDSGLQLVTFATFALFLVFGAMQVLNGGITLGKFVAFNALIALATGPLLVLLGMWDAFQYMRVLLARLDDFLRQEPEQGADRSHLTQVRSMEGRITLSNVGFSFGGVDGMPILSDVTLSVQPGQTVALVGRSGSGKSTLVRLLAGLIEPTSGSITFDGVELAALDYRSLRRHIGVVLQETYMFDDTVAANIAFGEAVPDPERLRWAAHAANALGFLERLPLGFDTRIGESGVRLSGGQQQRIAIARALYHQPPVLLLDEATSALDSESERAVKESLDELMMGRTSVVIAHRLSTIRGADRIVVLDRGQVVEQGTHDSLLAQQGLYYYLVSQQLEQ
jgi:ATP-binding cassette subfamily B protein